MISRNEKVPDLVLDSVVSSQREKIKLAHYRGKYLLIFFYPANFTFASPADIFPGENISKQFKLLDCQLVGISTEHIECLAKYQEKFVSQLQEDPNNLEVRLVSDPFQKIFRTFGILEEKNIAFRAVAILDQKGRMLSIDKSYSQDGFDMNDVVRKVRELKNKCDQCGG